MYLASKSKITKSLKEAKNNIKEMEKTLKAKLAYRPKRPYVFTETHPEEMLDEKPLKK